MPVVIVWGKGETTDDERARITRTLRSVGVRHAEIHLCGGRIVVRVATSEDEQDLRQAAAIALREAGFAVVGEK